MPAPRRFWQAALGGLVSAVTLLAAPVLRAAPPAAPTQLTVELTKAVDADFAAANNAAWNAYHTCTLRWQDNALDESGYRITARLPGGGPQVIGNVPAGSNTFTFRLALYAAGSSLQFQVDAYKMNGAAVESAGATATYKMPAGDAQNPPQAPSALSATATDDGTLTLQWTDNCNSEVYHQIAFRRTGAAQFSSLGFVYFNTSPLPLKLGLEPGASVEFMVRATRQAGASLAAQHTTGFSNVAQVTVPSLTTPGQLTGEVLGDTSLRFAWQDLSSNETAYALETRLEGGEFIRWRTFEANTRQAVVAVPPNTTLEWRVLALHQISGSSTVIPSAPSNIVTLTTGFPAPSNLTAATSPVAGAVDLAWQDNSTAEDTFDIYCRPEGETDWNLALVTPEGTQAARVTSSTLDGQTFVPLEPGVSYEFIVVARLAGSPVITSGQSNIATATADEGFTSRFYATGVRGEPLVYQLTTSSPAKRTGWQVTIPPGLGLTFDEQTGEISGTPPAAGVFICPISATFDGGHTAGAQLVFRIRQPQGAPALAKVISNLTLPPKGRLDIPLADKFSDPESETAVRLETTLGNVDILLYPSLTPNAVANFMGYVTSGSYDGVSFHRSLPGVLVQAGGFRPVATPKSFLSTTRRPSPLNEPGLSNLRGTIAAAKRQNGWDSATTDFYFNLTDTNASLDDNNGGYTVFGRLSTPGLAVVDAINALPTGIYVDTNPEGSYDPSLDHSILLDGAPYNVTDWPMNVQGAAPVEMNIAQTAGIGSARVIPALTYSLTQNTTPTVATATLQNGVLSITALTPGSTTLTVQMADLDGGSASQTFTVQVTTGHKPPAITKHPVSQSVAAGGKVTFSVGATGTALSYQWRRNGEELQGATGPTLPISNVQAAHEGVYDVLVGNATTVLTSLPARLDLKAAPAFTTQPQASQLVLAGQPLELNVVATGGPQPAFSWQRDGKAVAGQKLPRLLIPAAKLADGGTYTAMATSSSGKATSSTAVVVVLDMATTQHVVLPNSKLILTAPASGPITGWQWLKDGTEILADGPNLQGSKGATLTLTNLRGEDAGLYTCRITAAGGLGQHLTGVRRVSVVARPALTPPPAATTAVGLLFDLPLPYDPALTNTPVSFEAKGLPPGLVLNTATGHISGSPSRPGSYTYTAKAKNPAGVSDPVTGTITVLPLAANHVGVFLGAVEPVPGLNNNLGGRLDVTIEDSGALSGKLVLGVETLTFKGSLRYYNSSTIPRAELWITRKTSPPLLLVFATSPDTGELSGDVTDGTVTAHITGFRQAWSASWNPSTFFQGTYNMAVFPPANQPAAPQGSSYAAMQVGIGGTGSITGRMADGTACTASTLIGPTGQFLLFQTLYNGTGSVLARASIGTTNLAVNEKRLRVAGTARWLRLPQSKTTERSYRAGFGPLDLNLAGTNYSAPLAGYVLAGLPDVEGNLALLLGGGGLESSTTDPQLPVLRISSQNKAVLPATNPGRVTLTFSPATGGYSGTFQLVDGAVKRQVTFQGLFIPQIPITPAVAATSSSAAIPALPGLNAGGHGHFLLPQLPTTTPPTTLATSPVLSGQVWIRPQEITITQPPNSLSVNVGQQAVFNVAATGQGTLRYHWRWKGLHLPGATSAQLVIPQVLAGDAGDFDVIISNGAAYVVSPAATLTVTTP